MPIIVNEENKEFHLFNKQISYIFRVMDNNQLEHLYFGKALHHRKGFLNLVEREPRPLTSNLYEGNQTLSLEHIKQEYPCYGTTDFRIPAISIESESGSRITDFKFDSYRIFNGKKTLKGLPSTYVEEEKEADTLEIKLYDKVLSCELILSYTIYEDFAAICRNAKYINLGNNKLEITSAMSTSLDLPEDDYEMLHLAGAWSRERHIKMRKLQPGVQSIYSARGASSANHNPFLALKRPYTTENMGEVYGFSLVYSGNFLGQVEVDSYGVSRVTLGINPFNFRWALESSEEFQTPEAVMVFSDCGLNGMSQTFHKLYRTRLARGYWRDKVRPILINNWEATYFDFNEDKIMNIAKTAKELGIELFVLDDGWFGERNDDTSSLGDWFVNKNKLPDGIEGLSKKINNLGIKFGLWFEPEMVSKDSHIFKEHSEWVIHDPNRNMSHGRNQYVLDFSNKQVVDYIYNLMCKTIESSSISYIKWDMNRNITEAYSSFLNSNHQGELMHRYILGVYDLYDRLTTKFQEILFESCAAGGGRFDPGMLYYAPQAWTSDDTDAVERLKIQYGTSIVYPISSMGSHVSAVPNHQVGRITSIDTRANVAYFGTFGYELDLNKLSEEEKEKVKEQVEFFKNHRDLIQKGDFYRLMSPFEGNETCWIVVSKDKDEAIVGYYSVLSRPNDRYHRIKLTGLQADKLYKVEPKGTTHYGDELMNIGIILSEDYSGRHEDFYKNHPSDYSSRVFTIKEVREE